MEYKEW